VEWSKDLQWSLCSLRLVCYVQTDWQTPDRQIKNDLKVRPCFNLSKSFQIFLLVVKLGGVFALARVHVSTVLCAPRVREGWLRFGGWFVASGVVRTHVRVRWEGGLASPFRSHILPECCNALAAVTQTDNHTRFQFDESNQIKSVRGWHTIWPGHRTGWAS